MNKRGLEEEVLVTAIIIIVSFIILAVVVGKISGLIPGTITKETCHDSVVLRGIEIGNVAPAKSLASLKCQTEYKCLSMGGTCPRGYSVVSVSSQEDIKRELANSMYDCWWEMGEGKIDVFSNLGYNWNQVCSMCSIVTFDDKVQKSYQNISGLGEWMIRNQVPGINRTYWQYLTNSPAIYNYSVFSNEQYSTNQQYAVSFSFLRAGILSNIIAGGSGCALIGVAGAKLGAASLGFLSGPVGAGVGAVIGGGAGCAIGTFGGYDLQSWIQRNVGGQTRDYYASIFLVPYNADSFKSCTKIESIP